MESSALNFLTAFRILVETRTGPELPELAVLPVLPELPELPVLPALPDLPVLPELPELPELPAHTEQQTLFSTVNVYLGYCMDQIVYRLEIQSVMLVFSNPLVN